MDRTEGDERADRDVTRLGAMASRVFLNIEIIAYIVLGLMLAVAAILGGGGAAQSLWSAVLAHGEAPILIVAIDRLLFVLMVVEVLHTVRVSFRAGELACEPFLVVGLIASIRRVLVITMESSQVHPPGKWTADSQAILSSTMLELGVLGGLILVMVLSIWVLRHSESVRRRAALEARDHPAPSRRSSTAK